MLESLKKLFLNGLSVLLPFVFIIFIVKEAVNYIHDLIVVPIERFIPRETFMGIEITNYVALIIFIVLTLLTGVFLKTESGRNFVKKIGDIIPGFNLVKNFLYDKDELNQSGVKVCLAKPDESWQYGFIIEQHLSGMLTVYIPDAPNFTGGAVFFLTEEQVKRLDISAKEAGKYIMQLGFGSKNAFDNKIKW